MIVEIEKSMIYTGRRTGGIMKLLIFYTTSVGTIQTTMESDRLKTSFFPETMHLDDMEPWKTTREIAANILQLNNPLLFK